MTLKTLKFEPTVKKINQLYTMLEVMSRENCMSDATSGGILGNLAGGKLPILGL